METIARRLTAMSPGRPTRSLRAAGKGLALYILDLAGVFRLGRSIARRSLVVLTYHHVLPQGDGQASSRPPNTLFAQEFERQLAHIVSRYHVATGEEVRAFLAGRTPLPPLSIHLTFDDGYEDNYTVAFPILRRFGVSATFFLTTDFIGGSPECLWLNRLEAILAGVTRAELASWLQSQDLPVEARTPGRFRQWLKGRSGPRRDEMLSRLELDLGRAGGGQNGRGFPPMTWDQVREMAATGMTIGSHTASHQILSSASPEQVWKELTASRRRIEEELGDQCWSFSYPNGEATDFGPKEKGAIRAAGYACAFTQIPGFVTPQSDRFALPRMPVPDTRDMRVFLSRLSGVHGWLRARSRRVFGQC